MVGIPLLENVPWFLGVLVSIGFLCCLIIGLLVSWFQNSKVPKFQNVGRSLVFNFYDQIFISCFQVDIGPIFKMFEIL